MLVDTAMTALFELSPALRIEQSSVAGFPILTIDNLYSNPVAVRKLALSLDYSPVDGFYPGEQALVLGDKAPLLECLFSQIAARYGFERSAFRDSHHGYIDFRRMTLPGSQLTPLQTLPHVDSALLAGVVYLNLPEQCRGGTAFYRHIATGLESLYIEPGELKADERLDSEQQRALERMGLYNGYLSLRLREAAPEYNELAATIFRAEPWRSGYINGSSNEWEVIHTIEMRYNRLVLFPGFLFHSPLYCDEWFGLKSHQRRLTQNIFFPGQRSSTEEAKA